MRNSIQARGLWRALLAGAMLLALVLAGCSSAGGSPTGSGGAGATSALATSAPTFTPTPQTTVSPAQAAQACGGNASDYSQTTIYQAGDFYVSMGAAVPSARKLPDGTPLKPFKLNMTNTGSLTAQWNQQLPQPPFVNPEFGGFPYSGYEIGVCDASSTAHQIEGITVQIASFTPYSGALNTWRPCDGWYSSTPSMFPDCGSDVVATGELFKAAFGPTDGARTSVAATYVDHGMAGGPLPLTLQPGNGLSMLIGLTLPTVPGYYQFAFSIKADGANSPFVTDPEIFLLDSSAHKWSGAACQTAAMKAQVPNDGGYYICPE